MSTVGYMTPYIDPEFSDMLPLIPLGMRVLFAGRDELFVQQLNTAFSRAFTGPVLVTHIAPATIWVTLPPKTTTHGLFVILVYDYPTGDVSVRPTLMTTNLADKDDWLRDEWNPQQVIDAYEGLMFRHCLSGMGEVS